MMDTRFGAGWHNIQIQISITVQTGQGWCQLFEIAQPGARCCPTLSLVLTTVSLTWVDKQTLIKKKFVYSVCRVGETDPQDVYTVFSDHTYDCAIRAKVWVSCVVESCLCQLLGWEIATDLGWSLWFLLKPLGDLVQVGSNLCSSLLDAKGILEYVFRRFVQDTVSLAWCIAHKVKIISHTNSLSHKRKLCLYMVVLKLNNN